MTVILSSDPWPICVLAVGGILTGLTALLARHRKIALPAWRAPLVLAVVLALVGAGTLAIDLPAQVWQPALALAVVWLVFGLGRLGCLEKAARGLSHPRVQAGMLSLVSGSLLAWHVCEINRREEQDLDAAESHLAAIPRPPALDRVETSSALTDAGTQIPLFHVRPGSTAKSKATAEEDILSLHVNRKLIQTGPACDDYNCHGWVFTRSRFWVLGNSIEQILKENHYQTVSSPEAQDLAVFRDKSGEITHTGVVQSITGDGTVLLESKWGRLGRYIHTCSDHLYSDFTCAYYRSVRTGHLLRGIGGSLFEDHQPALLKSGGLTEQHAD
jgi:hypothetical protein